MALIICPFLLGIIVVCNGLHVLGPSGPLTVQPGGSVTLPCYVDTPIPVEELEVEWRRTDSDAVVHVFQDGESRPESQDQEYHDRTRLFTEEIIHGNFSLSLINVTVKDTGVYKCVIYRNQESNEAMVEIKMSDYLMVSGGHVVSAHAREDTTLTCSVQSNIPPEELQQVSWKKMDQSIIVLLFEQGQIKPESTHEKYRDRVELFNIEEIHKGNFSLRLKNIQTEDKGLYICEALHEVLSANTTVEVLQLGLSAIHNLELFLCACVCLCGISLLVICIPWWCFKENRNHMIKIQHGLVFCPNVIMFLAFVLWGQLEGFFSEVTTCSVINLLRSLRLLNFTPFIGTFGGHVQRKIKKSTAMEYSLMFAAVYLVLWHIWPSENDIMLAVLQTAVVLWILITLVFVSYIFLREKLPDVLFEFLAYIFCIGTGFLLCMNIVSVLLIVYWSGHEKDKLGLIFENVHLFILTGLTFTELIISGLKDPSIQPELVPFSRLCMCGVAVLFLMNSITLAAELVLSAQSGKRLVEDLQVILLPFEWLFALGCTLAILVVEFPGITDNENEEARMPREQEALSLTGQEEQH